MSERIDHVGEAHACEEAGLSIMRKNPMAPHMEAVMQFDLARLHAQLALVEQQRIANLIAYAADVDVIRSGNHDLSVKIREALGLS